MENPRKTVAHAPFTREPFISYVIVLSPGMSVFTNTVLAVVSRAIRILRAHIGGAQGKRGGEKYGRAKSLRAYCARKRFAVEARYRATGR